MTTYCVIYIRSSTVKQKIEIQRLQCEDFAKEYGLTVRSVHTDFGISGQSTKKRIALRDAIDTLQKGDALICRGIDRFSREPKDAEILLQEIANQGARFVDIEDRSTYMDLPIANRKRYAIIYAADNSDLSEEKYRSNYQIKECKKYAEQNGFEVKITYNDNDMDISLSERPGWKFCMKDTKEGDIILVFSLKRLTTNIHELEELLDKLRKPRIEVYILTEQLLLSSSYGNIGALNILNQYDIITHQLLRGKDDDHLLNMKDILEKYSHRTNYLVKKEKSLDIPVIYVLTISCTYIRYAKSLMHLYYRERVREDRKVCIFCHNNAQEIMEGLKVLPEYEEYVDENSILVPYTTNIEHIKNQLKELTNKDPIITTIGEIPTQFSNK